jgi:erythronate-4-phosphate dehydrogenase
MLQRKIICASSVLFGREAFSQLGEVITIPDEQISREHVCCADALIVRSKTRITPELLSGCSVRFVGTATSGTDHIHHKWLEDNGIAWSYAPGCNAQSVCDYVFSALFMLASQMPRELSQLTIGIIGAGQIGSLVADKAASLGMQVLLNDPPRASLSKDPVFQPLEKVLKESDIVSLHVPLTTKGAFPTAHMANCRFFCQLKPGTVFINAARGGVIETESLALAIERGIVSHAVLDVWEREPYIDAGLLDQSAIATPHIAGYSMDGKLAGTLKVYHDACHFFEEDPAWTPPPLPPQKPDRITIDARGKNNDDILWETMQPIYDIRNDDQALRAGLELDDCARAQLFKQLRTDYPPRRETPATEIKLEHATPDLVQRMQRFGFTVLA